MTGFLHRLAGAALLLPALTGVAAGADCREAALAERIATAWAAGKTVAGLPAGLSMERAGCIRSALVERLMASQGRIVGYKAGLTSAALQRRFGHDAPVRGVLLARMLLPERDDTVSARFGARPIAEADLLAEVGSASINAARTRLDALRGLSRVIPFIELADLTVAEGEPLTAAVITAINVGARAGVVGRRAVPVEATQAFADRLAAMRIVIEDGHGKKLGEGRGSAVLGHPLDAVLWLVADLERAGVRLRPGDLLSLGAFVPPVPPRPGLQMTVRYEGLPGDPAVGVRFE